MPEQHGLSLELSENAFFGDNTSPPKNRRGANVAQKKYGNTIQLPSLKCFHKMAAILHLFSLFIYAQVAKLPQFKAL